VQSCVKEAKDRGLCKSGNKIICIQANNEETPDESSVMKVIDIQ